MTALDRFCDLVRRRRLGELVYSLYQAAWNREIKWTESGAINEKKGLRGFVWVDIGISG